MDNFNTVFTIKDLENISGVKAHTIRIWEKRYNLLHPKRTDTNIRYYTSESLLKLLNIVFLNQHAFKISKIAQMSDEEIVTNARELALETTIEHNAINSFKLAMFQFDKKLFNTTYHKLLLQKDFSQIFKEIFVPLLQHIRLLWQTKTMLPAHEHFICNLILQKIHVQIEKTTCKHQEKDYNYVLFLPEHKINEINLLYINYELLTRGNQTIYLGKNLPFENLEYFLNNEYPTCFITSLTYNPFEEKTETYLRKIDKVLKNTDSKLMVFDEKTKVINDNEFSSEISVFNDLTKLIEAF